jgi:hypothetical protein
MLVYQRVNRQQHLYVCGSPVDLGSDHCDNEEPSHQGFHGVLYRTAHLEKVQAGKT